MKNYTSADNDRYCIRNAWIVKKDSIVKGDACFEEGVISYVGSSRENTEGFTVIDGSGKYLLPGFIDIHCHGGQGFDLTSGLYDVAKGAFDPSLDNYPDAIGRLMQSFAGHGTTRVLLTTLAAPADRLETVMGAMQAYMESDRNGQDGALLAGAFNEGTFIRQPEYAGAQNPDYFMQPDVTLFDRMNEAAGGHIRYVNVAPEYGEPALKLTAALKDRGILVGAGHTSCPADQYAEAVKRGLKVAVHFTNGPTGSSFKPFNGGDVLECVLTSRQVFAEVIADGYHVNPAYVMDILHRKGTDRTVAITDAMFACGAEGLDAFEVSGIKGKVSENGRYLQVTEKANTLFGSVLTMSVAFSNWVSWLTRPMPGIWTAEHPPRDTHEAVCIASRLCSVNPALLLGQFEPAALSLGQKLADYTGSLEVGKSADAVLLSLDGEQGNYAADIASAFVRGRRVHA